MTMASRLTPKGDACQRAYAQLRLLSRQGAHPRLFTQNCRLRLLTPQNQRPQLPFLYPGSPSTSQTSLQAHLTRFLTTATKGEIKRQFFQGLRWSIILGLIQIIALSSYFGGGYLVTNTQHPSPREWRFWTLFAWLTVKQFEEGGGKGTPYGAVVDWGAVASASKELLKRLEDPELEGAGLQSISHEEGQLHVDGVARTGVDVSTKSEEWRRCYYEALLGAAKAAENLEGWVADKKRMLTFPKDSVVGPSNPNPKALQGQSRKMPEPPREEDTAAFDSPDTFYLKILTTFGFTSKQRLEAALSYADWLEYQDNLDRAEELYDWGLDIALGSLPHGANKVVDIRTGIIYKDADHVSANILLASSSLASFHAKRGKLSAALPIYLSVLRARRNLPSPSEADGLKKTKPSQPSSFQLLKTLFTDPGMGAAPSSGDEIPVRAGSELCDEAGIISNIGEILFASSARDRSSGLSWTREAADLAESVLDSPDVEDKEAREKCSDCLKNAMENWITMVDTMVKYEKADAGEREASVWFWRRNNGGSGGVSWENEAEAVKMRLRDVSSLLGELERKYKTQASVLSALQKPGGG